MLLRLWRWQLYLPFWIRPQCSFEEKKNVRETHVFFKSIQYKSILSEVMRFFVSGLGILNRYFGTHIFRKTFYFFGRLGGAEFESLKISARHKHNSSASLVCENNLIVQLCSSVWSNAILLPVSLLMLSSICSTTKTVKWWRNCWIK